MYRPMQWKSCYRDVPRDRIRANKSGSLGEWEPLKSTAIETIGGAIP